MAISFTGPAGYHLSGGKAMGGLAGYFWAPNDPTGEELSAAERARTSQTTGLANSILGLRARATELVGSSVQSGYQAAGAAAEAEAYRIAAGYAGVSAEMATGAAGLRAYQEQLNVTRTAGSQRAGIAAAGFQEAGSAIDLLHSTIRQGAISTALIELQGNIEATGYLAEAAALTGQSEVAMASRDAAGALLTAQQTASQQATNQALELQMELDKLAEAPLADWANREWPGEGAWAIRGPGASRFGELFDPGVGGRGLRGRSGAGSR